MKILIAAIVLSVIAQSAEACKFGTCHACRQKVVQQVVAVPTQVFYFVGRPLRVAAIIAQEKATDPDYQEFQRYKEWKARQGTQPAKIGALATHCAACHGASLTQPKGGLFFDSGNSLSGDQITKALKAIRDGTMPKNKPPLKPEEKAALMEELLNLHRGEEK